MSKFRCTPAILKCINLEILNLSNSLSRSKEVKFEEKEFINDLCSSLFKLQKLNLSHSMVTSDWLKSMSQLESLTKLGLRDTQIENLEFLIFSEFWIFQIVRYQKWSKI